MLLYGTNLWQADFGVVLDCQNTHQPLSAKARLRGRCFAISFGGRLASKISKNEHFVWTKIQYFLEKIVKIYDFSKIFEKITLIFFGNLRFFHDFLVEKGGSGGVLFELLTSWYWLSVTRLKCEETVIGFRTVLRTFTQWLAVLVRELG